MKQSKKLTRNQRNYLEKHHVNTEGVRFIQENSTFFEYVTKDGKTHKIIKQNDK